ncbi:Protein phosphatase 1B (Protein phosphatase 2C isoform beta) (PP2C-beta) [Durusdinium trenchii]|uniref:protein-serine/threonine phosphatase n=1 Tax=Durusdinium trenchii TaxID=1381693 RepID=A0ABP0IKC2_9DINO
MDRRRWRHRMAYPSLYKRRCRPVGQRVRQGRLIPRSLVVVETIDHKPGAQFSGEAPDHPTEKQRIETAGGTVSFEDPPRLDGSLAVSRGLGDFEYKADGPEAQGIGTVSCIPDIYEVSSLAPGTLCILGCDGIWDVRARPGRRVAEDAGRVRPGTTVMTAEQDLGDIAAEILRQCLQRNSRDNMTCMIMHFADGSDWANFPDEMKNYDKLLGKTSEP